MPLQETSGNSTQDAYGGGAAAVVNYIEDVFSTYLYTGTGAAQTITNGIDLAGSGGMLWLKSRSNAYSAWITDSARGVSKGLAPSRTSAQTTDASAVTGYTATGFTLGTDGGGSSNTTGSTQVSWTFRKQTKFFDVVTYTGDGANRTISHNLGSVPGCIIIKKYAGSTSNWGVYHTSVGNGTCLFLDDTGTGVTSSVFFNNTSPTSTVFSVGTNDTVNTNGASYVAYIFAHNAGGFGLTGTDNVISCGSFTADGSGKANITLGYEPQWVLIKNITQADGWYITDTMRGMPVTPATNSPFLSPNTSAAESSWGSVNGVNATGWNTSGLTPSNAYIYIAIRRGPMKVPTDATKVFSPLTRTGTGANATVNASILTDTTFIMDRTPGWQAAKVFDRLRGATNLVYSNTTGAEVSDVYTLTSFANQTGYVLGSDADNYDVNVSGSSYINWNFGRAPSFFDEVCYTGTGANTTFTHNLGVVPELMIVKSRSAAGNQWAVYAAPLGNTDVIYLNKTDATSSNAFVWNNTTPTSSVFTVSIAGAVNSAGATYVAYLFATCAGVSKVGSYTGNGTTQAIACGFTGGARFVLIKRTDSTGGWYVYDTARGMTVLTDPYLFLNSTAAEAATLGSVTTTTGGFTVNAAILAAINTSSATYIFLAIA